MSLAELDRLFEQFFALVEATVGLSPGTERRRAFRKIGEYGGRIDDIAVRVLEQENFTYGRARQSTFAPCLPWATSVGLCD